MGELFANLRLIQQDVKDSWYFRIWVFLWVIFFVVIFVALVSLSARSDAAGKQRQILFWVENASYVEFPRFHIRFDTYDPASANETFMGSPECKLGPFSLLIQDCKGMKGTSRCFAVDTSKLFAKSDNVDLNQQRITCTIITTGFSATSNNLLAWELEEDRPFGDNSYASMWFNAKDAPGAWIMLRKAFLSSDTDEIDYGNDAVQHPVWERSLVYHTSVSTPGTYVVSTVIETFRVEHYSRVDSYNGWMAVGEIGGFAYFMIFLHTILMITFGFCFDNTSKFLKHELTGPESQPFL